MLRIATTAVIATLIISTTGDLLAGCFRRQSRCATFWTTFCPLQTLSPAAECCAPSAVCCSPAATCCVAVPCGGVLESTADTNDGDADRTESDEDVVEADPPTDEERAWFEELVQKDYVEVEFAAQWESMSSAARAAMYRDIKAAEAESAGVTDGAEERDTTAAVEDSE